MMEKDLMGEEMIKLQVRMKDLQKEAHRQHHQACSNGPTKLAIYGVSHKMNIITNILVCHRRVPKVTITGIDRLGQ
jgi:hypothetical protein